MEEEENQPLNWANGHRASALLHLLHPALRAAPKPDPKELAFDLDAACAAVLTLGAVVPDDAFTAPFLGTERSGSGIVIDDDGLVLTIGYLIVEATSVHVAIPGGGLQAAQVVAYDYDSGFGLVRAERPLGVRPLRFGDSATLRERDPVIVATQGGRAHAISGNLVSKREFAGYWEYLLDEALFTTPPHPNWGGAALLGLDGTLCGVGSLYLEDALPGRTPLPGNMFVPIDLLKPIFEDLMRLGRAPGEPRPWLGMFTAEAMDQMLVAGVAPGGPADRADIRSGDVLLAVAGQPVLGMAEMYRAIWGLGSAGVDIPLSLLRDGDSFDVIVRSGDRYQHLKLPRRH